MLGHVFVDKKSVGMVILGQAMLYQVRTV